ncbi:MAG: nucleoside deaminase [Rhodospirillales bacterium]|nr:nucleoside deaminase [Rhodospirillales bacterium]
MSEQQDKITARLLDVMEHDIAPKTRAGVNTGNKVFGAAILLKSDLSLVIAGTNNETTNPLYHGEISALQAFYELPEATRPATRDCLFLATHEPCSLCLSAITWTGFDNFYYFFGYEDTRDAFNIPHDLKILKEVFKVEDGDYARKNSFWECHDLIELAAPELTAQIQRIRSLYDDLSATYQGQKGGSSIPLS